jgi:hypothetical protein
MILDPDTIDTFVEKTLYPAFKHERERCDKLDRWVRWDHDKPHTPIGTITAEYRQLIERSQAPWGDLVISAVAQGLYVEGYRQSSDTEDADAWSYWQANCLDARQIAVHRAALTYALAYTTVVPGKDILGLSMPVIRGVSAREMVALYDDPGGDDWPMVAMRGQPTKLSDGSTGWRFRVYDDANVYDLIAGSGGDAVKLQAPPSLHGSAVCPVVRFANKLDLEGRSDGEIEGIIPLLGRIDQTAFDRLVVQRFASWIVRWVAGMETVLQAKDPKNPTFAEVEAATMRLKVSDFLVSGDPDTKFGSLPASPLDGFIAAHDADVRELAALTQTPPHNLLGQMVNLSAEALAAAETGATRKRLERQHAFGESWEQSLRLAAALEGNVDAARNMEAEVVWRDVESRSLAQAVDALGKLAQLLGVPVEILWEKIPGWTQQDVERARDIAKQAGGLTLLAKDLLPGQTSAPASGVVGLTKTGAPAHEPLAGA